MSNGFLLGTLARSEASDVTRGLKWSCPLRDVRLSSETASITFCQKPLPAWDSRFVVDRFGV